ncbi:AAA family ATPase [Tenacibaculum finnmarkense]|uniref:AbiJ-related protein n=1 Tax=Tenacibaculum finnmarkense TaxID=2781243 RepID=UPI0023018CF4|nr:AAA family ATPase [Tenacibaculum finnmarkense]WCC45998.1 AAA family ATPase [Tenacibaculum finnmarkense]
MIKYSKELKLKVFRKINAIPDSFTVKDDGWYNGIINFLNNIWDLKNIPIVSGDSRWENAYDDAVQHLVNNSDWTYEETFIGCFKLLENDEDFTKFLETLVHPDFRNDLTKIESYVSLVNAELSSINYNLAVSGYKEDLPIYTLRESKQDDKIDILDNSIPFLVDTHTDIYPYFYLESIPWDDYGNKTSFILTYYIEDFISEEIGLVKITDGKNFKTSDVIDKKFISLKSTFCSLGQDEGYYRNLQRIFSNKLSSVLYALKDVAYFIKINDNFSSNDIYKYSLIREDDVEKLSRNIKFILEGRSLENKYHFSYKFTPNYSYIPVEIDLNFNNTLDSSDRIFAIIGKNGAGKTQLITSLPVDISESKEGSFKPDKPIFSKIIAISYSIFDSFKKPDDKNNFNYVFCGLLNDDKTLPSKVEKNQKIIESYNKIKHHNRIDKWKNILENFIDKDILNDVFITNGLRSNNDENDFVINESKLINILDKLSSGQSIMLDIMTKIIANIRYDSLILFDEPETHLHPNAISQLINSIYELVESFDSYCLITTHSPIIIQNIFGKNVYVMEKDNNIPFLRKIGIESFGENLTILTEDVFENRDINKHYKIILDKMINEYFNYEIIIQKIENENLPLSLNAKLYLKSKL